MIVVNSKFVDFKDHSDPEKFIKAIKDMCDGVGPHAAVVAAAGAAAYEQALEVCCIPLE